MFFRTAAGSLITPYRQPTGPFSVGSITRLVTDPSRRNRYGISTNGSFMITVWYPALPEAGRLPDRHDDPYASDNTFRQDPIRAVERARWWRILFRTHRLLEITQHTLSFCTQVAAVPVVLNFSARDRMLPVTFPRHFFCNC
jgi:hypothetical protein